MQAVFHGLVTAKPLFCCSEGVHCVSAAWVARHGRGRGAYRRLGARRGQRCVPLHAIPRRGLAVTYAVRPWELRRFHALRGIGFGKSGGVSKVSMGAISLSLVFPPLPLVYRRAAYPQGLGHLLLGQPLCPPQAADRFVQFHTDASLLRESGWAAPAVLS